MTRMSRTERAELCDTALALGGDQPTLCGDWTVKDLVVHLLVRERSPAAAGIVLSPLQKLTDLESRRFGARDFAVLVEQLRGGPPRWSPYAVPKLDQMLNTLEYFVHHEDIRRAQPEWHARQLPEAQERLLWSMIRTAGKALVRKAPVGVVIENSVTGSRAVLKEAAGPAGGGTGGGPGARADVGDAVVTVRGLPSEVTMYVFGRADHARVELLGPDAAVAALGETPMGV